MLHNPFDADNQYENNLEGLVLPYRLVSRTDREIFEDKFRKRRKASSGIYIRLGIAEPGGHR